MIPDLAISEKNKEYHPEKEKHFPALDGLRGLALFFILLYHNFNYLSVVQAGWIGMDIFFVLSGFLITTTLLQHKDRPHPFRLFYSKRALRIFPLYFLAFPFFIYLLPHLTTLPDQAYYTSHQAWFWIFAENWLYIFHPVPSFEGSYIVHFWSLGLEEQYYLVWPWLVLFIRSPRTLVRVTLLLLTALLAARIIVWLKSDHPESLFLAFGFTRVEGLFTGSILAIATGYQWPRIERKILRIIFATGALCLLLLILRHYIPSLLIFPFGGYLFISLAAAWVIHRTRQQTRVPILTSRFFVYLGKISYGVYIFHWPIFVLLSPRIQSLLSGGSPLRPELTVTSAPAMATALASSLSCLLLSILLAHLSYYNYEIYFLNLKKRLPFSHKGR